MGETSFHSNLVIYLMELLRWLFHGQLCAIYDNLNFYQTNDPQEYPIAPDIAIIKGVSEQPATSWRVGKRGPAPQVVFEIGSEETWRKDLTGKPHKYAEMGVQEYFAYDPNEPRLLRRMNRRLFGWQFDPHTRSMSEMQPRSDGALWSPNLESWLVPDETMLRLYDRNGQMRLTGMEAEARRANALAEKLRSLGVDPDQISPDQLL